MKNLTVSVGSPSINYAHYILTT